MRNVSDDWDAVFFFNQVDNAFIFLLQFPSVSVVFGTSLELILSDSFLIQRVQCSPF